MVLYDRISKLTRNVLSAKSTTHMIRKAKLKSTW